MAAVEKVRKLHYGTRAGVGGGKGTWKPTAGRATSEVSSRKIFVLEKGIAYRNVGSRLLSQLNP